MFSKSLLVAVAIVCLTACATSFERVSPNHNFGQPPANTEAAIRAHFETRLFDAESARYIFGEIYAAQCNEGLAYGGNVTWTGWAQNIQINAKNRFGGYVGYEPFTVTFNSGGVGRDFEGHNFGPLYGGGLCRRVANPLILEPKPSP